MKAVIDMLSFKIDDELTLRIMNERDAYGAFKEVDASRDYLATWLPWVNYTHSAEDYKKFIQFTRDEFAKENSFHFGIYNKKTFIGGFSLNKVNRTDNKVEFGYWLGKSHQKRGIVSRVVSTMTDFVFNEWDVHRIEIHVCELNEPSRKVPERLGFSKEAVLCDAMRLDGRYHNLLIYGKLNPNHVNL